jgi:hypothetical protein
MLGNIFGEDGSSMTAKSPTVSLVVTNGPNRNWQAVLYIAQPVRRRIAVDSRDWFDWLEQARSFAYPTLDASKGYIEGWMTVRKERRQRGRQYWVAYRRCQGRLRKVYLGASGELTQVNLDRVAQRFLVAKQACGPLKRDNGGFQ